MSIVIFIHQLIKYLNKRHLLRILIFGSVAESVDAPDLKSVENYLVGVQVPPLLLGRSTQRLYVERAPSLKN
jgi:hypothetical protein